MGAIGVYGVAMIGFALPKVLVLSMIALAVTGADDMISVFIRQSIIQLATLVTAAAWFRLFPQLAKTDALDQIDEEPAKPPA